MMYSTKSKISEIARTRKGKAVLEKLAPQVFTYPANSYIANFMGDYNLEQAVKSKVIGITEECAQKILAELKKPEDAGNGGQALPKSMDELDRESFAIRSLPFDGDLTQVTLKPGDVSYPEKDSTVSLDGTWDMVEGGSQADRLQAKWEDVIPAEVPGSIHTALVNQGRLPDPSFGLNQKIARPESFKTWWMKKTFPRPESSEQNRLVFGGVCNRCSVWLNGALLGEHEGMFGGPEFDVSGQLKDSNELVVKLEPIPFEAGGIYDENNASWKTTVVFNNVYGWHYSNMQSQGIWENVELVKVPAVEMVNPFISATDHENGTARLLVEFSSKNAFQGKLVGEISPANFEGEVYHFSHDVESDGAEKAAKLQFQVPNPKLWWPVDLGDPNLYTLKLWFVQDEEVVDFKKTTFGIRSVEMAPLPDGPKEDLYNWTFVINGQPRFVKGTNWCTMDSLMDFSRERYERFLSLAAEQHVQLVRAWGSGMPETDEFYALCDELGLMVLQEWPTAWNSHETQPYEMLEETVRLSTLRTRNHASVVMYGAGNESSEPFGKAIDMMGRLSYELDGTRMYHRGEPWGGSEHNYTCYWGRAPLDFNVAQMKARFWGEFGLACQPHFESVSRYLPDDEKDVWPPQKGGTIEYHSPIFGYADDLARQLQYSYYFVDKDNCDVEKFTVGSQLSQAVGLRHPLERARTRWPFTSGACYYKINDNYPAASWATADWYGVPKISYYFVQDAFAPLHACVLFSTLNMAGTPTDALDNEIFLLDDANALDGKDWQVVVRVYGGDLQRVKSFDFSGQGSIDAPHKLGKFELNFAETDTSPLLVTAEVRVDGKLADRTFYFANFEKEKGSLFTLPQTSLDWRVEDDTVVIENTGELPAVAVYVEAPGKLDTFKVSDSYFWMEPGEKRTVKVSQTDGLKVGAWNAQA
jgi:beta-mannosidase